MRTKSRDGRFIISSSTLNSKEPDVFLKAIKGREIKLLDLAYTLFFDCFENDGIGLGLKAKRLRCHLYLGTAKENFWISRYNEVDGILRELATMIKL